MRVVKTRVPWQLKIPAKIVFSRLPVPYAFWKKVGLFESGFMDDVSYARDTFASFYERASFKRKGDPFVSLELGPGDSLLTALIAKTFGASKTYLVDVHANAISDIAFYRRAANQLMLEHPGVFSPDAWTSVQDMLVDCNAEYLTDGLRSLETIPTESVDFIWSHAVLEHVKRAEMERILGQFRRIIRNDGYSCHDVDLKDHLGFALNSLRFRETIWEGSLFARSGFYTNRLRQSQYIEYGEKLGFGTSVTEEHRWDELPTPKAKMDPVFQRFDDEELKVQQFVLCLEPNPKLES